MYRGAADLYTPTLNGGNVMHGVKSLVCLAALAAVLWPGIVQAQADRYDALANSPMVENRPTSQTSQLLKDELLFQRATQTYLWALPLIKNWLRVLGSAELSQIDQGVRQQFHAKMSLLQVFKP